MALGTLTKITSYVNGNKRVRIYDVQLTSGANYTTGGETITAAAVGLRKVEKASPDGMANTSSGSTAHGVGMLYQSNGNVKIQAYSSNGAAPAAFAELGANANLSTFVTRVQFTGV